MKRTYLDDGVYADWNGEVVRLWSDKDDGFNEVFLQPLAISLLHKWLENQMNAAAGKKKSLLDDC